MSGTKHCEVYVYVFLLSSSVCYLYNTKLSQSYTDLHPKDNFIHVLCEAPGGLDEPGAVSESIPQWQATWA